MAIRLDTSSRKHALITFLLEPDQPPGAVSVVGSFNDWTPGQHQLESDGDDPMRRVTVAVPYGEEIYFRYLAADGLWLDDPEADAITEHGSVVRAAQAPAKVPSAPRKPASAPRTRKTAPKKVSEAAPRRRAKTAPES